MPGQGFRAVQDTQLSCAQTDLIMLMASVIGLGLVPARKISVLLVAAPSGPLARPP
jgi:hypothetical protein